jgi:hypothetical protein
MHSGDTVDISGAVPALWPQGIETPATPRVKVVKGRHQRTGFLSIDGKCGRFKQTQARLIGPQMDRIGAHDIGRIGLTPIGQAGQGGDRQSVSLSGNQIKQATYGCIKTGRGRLADKRAR